MKIILSPYAKPLRIPKAKNAKNYPWFPKVISLLEAKGHEIIQIGQPGEFQLTKDFRTNLSMSDLVNLIKESDTFIGVDNFFQHMAHYYNFHGVVIFGTSDPSIFGYPENINLLKSKSNLRPGWQQFDCWEAIKYNTNVFVDPNIVVKAVLENKFNT